MATVKKIREDLLYPELSYKIVGTLFQVSNKLGGGYLEKYYQKAVAESLKIANLKFVEQVHAPFMFNGVKIGKCFLDFLVDDKIILELKKGNRFFRKDIEQVYSYLKINNLQLGILANFTNHGVETKRIVNIN